MAPNQVASPAGGQIQIRLLGGLEIRRGGDQLPPLESARTESLLAYLLLHRDEPQQRQHIAFHLWPDSTEEQARTNLRHILHNLRHVLPEADKLIEVGPRTLTWRPALPTWLDVAAFEQAILEGRPKDAVALYAGDLLAGRTDEWVEEQRVRLRRRYLDALEQLVTASKEHGDLVDAVRYAEQLLREEPLREETYRALMRLHDALGDRARAVRVYHECAATLERELGVEPAAETRATYDALLARDERPAATRLGGPPFVGRTAERAKLAAAWRNARPGRPHVVLLAGESGIGKTRLAEELRAWAAHRGAVTAVARAYPGEGALAYGPIVAWLRSEGLKVRLNVLARPYLTELARLLPELVASVPGLTRPQRLPESEQRQRLYDAVVTALAAPDTPLLLVADDVQWWDRDALQLLHYLIRTRPAAPLLVVATTRREEMETAAPLRDLLVALRLAGTLSEIDLDRLNRAETGLLAEQIGRGPITDAAVAALYEQTEGNPLFVVEALRAGWQVGGDVLTPKVHAVIQSRLAQLSVAARDLVDVAATVGREFTAEVLSLASRTTEDAVVHALDELWRRRIIGEHNAVAYDFSHDTIREVAYAALSPMRRRYLHGQVAQALATAFAGDLDSISGQLARHYEEAGALDHAVAAYACAADVAQQLYAHGESARLLTRGLELLTRLPANAQRARRELELSTALLAPLVATEGYASPRIHETHQRALTLARFLGVEPSPPLLRSMGLGSLARGDFAAAKEYGAALRHRGDRDDDDVLRVEGEYVLGVAAFWAGELTDARDHLERAVATHRVENRREHLLRYAQDPKVICLTRLALAYWFLGDREAAIRARDQGLAFAEEIGHPYSQAVGLLFASLLALDMNDTPALRRFVERAKVTAPEGAGVQVEGAIAALDAYVGILDSGAREGIARIQQVVADARDADQAAPGLRSALLRILLAACEAAGDARTGVAAADELIALSNSVVWRPEARRLREKFLTKQHPANT